MCGEFHGNARHTTRYRTLCVSSVKHQHTPRPKSPAGAATRPADTTDAEVVKLCSRSLAHNGRHLAAQSTSQRSSLSTQPTSNYPPQLYSTLPPPSSFPPSQPLPAPSASLLPPQASRVCSTATSTSPCSPCLSCETILLASKNGQPLLPSSPSAGAGSARWNTMQPRRSGR